MLDGINFLILWTACLLAPRANSLSLSNEEQAQQMVADPLQNVELGHQALFAVPPLPQENVVTIDTPPDVAMKMIQDNQFKVKEITDVISKQKIVIDRNMVALTELKALVATNQRILRANQEALQDAANRLLGSVKTFTSAVARGQYQGLSPSSPITPLTNQNNGNGNALSPYPNDRTNEQTLPSLLDRNSHPNVEPRNNNNNHKRKKSKSHKQRAHRHTLQHDDEDQFRKEFLEWKAHQKQRVETAFLEEQGQKREPDHEQLVFSPALSSRLRELRQQSESLTDQF